ncbi:MAG: monovalent cation/H(+) antiporter subunit G, partial [Pseudomonadota bacterium]
GLVMAGTAVHFGDGSVVVRCVLVVFFLLLTAPIAAHMIGRAAITIGIKPWENKESDPQDPAREDARPLAKPLGE